MGRWVVSDVLKGFVADLAARSTKSCAAVLACPVPKPRRKLGLGIFLSRSTYIEGKRSEFFEVPAPIWYMRGEPGIFPSPIAYMGKEIEIFPSPRAFMGGGGAKSNISTNSFIFSSHSFIFRHFSS